jgi:hypothetical protein
MERTGGQTADDLWRCALAVYNEGSSMMNQLYDISNNPKYKTISTGRSKKKSNPIFLDWIANSSHPCSNDQKMDWILILNGFYHPKMPDLEREIPISNKKFQLRKTVNGRV